VSNADYNERLKRWLVNLLNHWFKTIPGGRNCSTSRIDKGIVRWGEIFHFFPPAKWPPLRWGSRVSSGVLRENF